MKDEGETRSSGEGEKIYRGSERREEASMDKSVMLHYVIQYHYIYSQKPKLMTIGVPKTT